MASDSIDVIEKSYDSAYLKKFQWPGELASDDAATVQPALQQLQDDALECFIIHNALVDQLKSD